MSDLIERQAAIDALVNHSYPVRYDFGFTSIENGMTVTGIRQALSELPTIEPERPTGRWIRHAIGHENTPWGFDCSVCNKWFVIGEDAANQYNYCPNCGAKMEGGA